MAGFTGASPIVTDGLVFAVDAANYESYPGSGTTCTDLVGGNNGTLINGPTFDSANGGSIVFDGTNEYLNVSSSDIPPLEDYSSFTINGWFKPSSSQASNPYGVGAWLALFCYANPTDNYLTLQRSAATSTMVLYHAGGAASLGSIYSDIYSGTWVNVVLTFSSGNVVIYLDGSQLSSVSGISLGSPSSQFFRVFSERSTLTTKGDFSNLSIYDRLLSASEISQNYNALKSRFGL